MDGLMMIYVVSSLDTIYLAIVFMFCLFILINLKYINQYVKICYISLRGLKPLDK